MMNLLDKFETVTIKADVRITPEDKAFCEAHQAAYDAAVQSFQELAFFWADMENTQKELLGGSDTSYLSSRDGPEISQRQINKHLEHLHWAVIYNKRTRNIHQRTQNDPLAKTPFSLADIPKIVRFPHGKMVGNT